MSNIKFDSECVRKKSNWSTPLDAYKFDSDKFDPARLLSDIKLRSPKLNALLNNIKRLDKRDMEKDGVLYKHFIFSDIKSGSYGAKLLAAAMISSGYNLGYSAPRKDEVNKIMSEASNVLANATGTGEASSGSPNTVNSILGSIQSVFGPAAPPNTLESKPVSPVTEILGGDGDDDEDEEDAGEKRKKKKIWGKMQLHEDAKLKETPNANFFLLSSVGVYDQPISVSTKKEILKKFNQRPDNIHGEDIRFIVMDSGYKEGIDLFDIKYIHIFEPSKNAADQKQVIGRGTRTCGQKGLRFNPTKGWPLHVFIYNLSIPDQLRPAFLGSASTFDLYLKSLNIDLRLYQFMNDLEQTSIYGSVDYDLNRNIHQFAVKRGDGSLSPDELREEIASIELDTPIISPPPDWSPGSRGSANTEYTTIDSDEAELIGGSSIGMDMKLSPHLLLTDKYAEPKKPRKPRTIKFVVDPNVPPVNLDIPESDIFGADGRDRFDGMRKYINDNFSEFKWDEVVLKNACEEKPMAGGASQLITLSPTQNFIKHYFTPQNPCKGMLLWHSVGTGKTCSAIAAATNTFERSGYTILWVTRTTLKSDIWKNMFDQVCSDRIRGMIESGKEIPNEQSKRMRLLSKSWKIRPMSYKQFSNLVLKQNNFYKSLVKLNGSDDPLRKTLLIIDEAHKLYGGGDLSSIERPDMDALHASLMNSYRVSGRESVRLLLMTATPVTESPMEFVKLINLCKPVFQQIPDDFNAFSQEYLNEEGRFTDSGRIQYLNDIAGHVSYLNREKDARQFSQPVIKMVNVPIVPNMNMINSFDKRYMREIIDSDVLKLKNELEDASKSIDSDLKELTTDRFGFLYDKCKDIENASAKKKCRKMVKSNITLLLAEAKDHVAEIKNAIKDLRLKVKDSRIFKTRALKSASGKIELNKDKYEKFKSSPYYTIKYKCSEKITRESDLDQQAAVDPEVLRLDAQIAAMDMEIHMLNENLKTEMAAFNARFKRLRELLREKMTHQEKANVRLSLKTQRTLAKKEIAQRKSTVNTIITNYNKTKKVIQDKRKKAIRRTKKALMSEIQEKKKNDRKIQMEIQRAEKSLRKTMRKEGQYEDIKNDLVNQLVEKYKAQINQDYIELEGEILRNVELDRQRAAAKRQEKEEKEANKREKAEEKTRKQQEKAEEKTRKQREKAEEKEANKREKSEENTRKQREKMAAAEARKTQKVRENQEKIQYKNEEKARLKAEKELLKQQAKTRK